MAGIEATTEGASFWEDSRDTHKANDGYYLQVASALEALVVPSLVRTDRLLDFGCGNGEYTEQLAAHCGSAVGIDVSTPLIEAARARTRPDTIVRYEVGETPPTDEHFDVVSCMGVLVCLLSDTEFVACIEALARCVRPGGTLLLRETLSWGDAQLVEQDDYVAHYRTPLDYLRPLATEGIELVHDEHLVTWSVDEQRSNHLWLLQRPT